MKLIIDISEGSYNTIKECYERGELLTTICMQIATGTPYEERPQGEWEEYACSDEQGCSLCGYMDRFYFEHHFCPNCGAKMQKGEEE